MGKLSYGGQTKRYKDTVNASLKDFNIPTESWEYIVQDRAKMRGFMRRGTGEYEGKGISGKPELMHNQQSFLPQISLVLFATGSFELRVVSSAILEHTNSSTPSI